MTYTIFLALHLLGFANLFMGLAIVLLPPGDTRYRKLGVNSFICGMLLLFMGGFGMIGMGKLGFPWWVAVKLVLWLGVGAMPIIGKRGLLPVPAAYTLAMVCALIAILLGTTHGNLGALYSI